MKLESIILGDELFMSHMKLEFVFLGEELFIFNWARLGKSLIWLPLHYYQIKGVRRVHRVRPQEKISYGETTGDTSYDHYQESSLW